MHCVEALDRVSAGTGSGGQRPRSPAAAGGCRSRCRARPSAVHSRCRDERSGDEGRSRSALTPSCRAGAGGGIGPHSRCTVSRAGHSSGLICSPQRQSAVLARSAGARHRSSGGEVSNRATTQAGRLDVAAGLGPPARREAMLVHRLAVAT